MHETHQPQDAHTEPIACPRPAQFSDAARLARYAADPETRRAESFGTGCPDCGLIVEPDAIRGNIGPRCPQCGSPGRR